jgi:hypothetical protein
VPGRPHLTSRLLRPVPLAVRGAMLSAVLLLAACGGPVELTPPSAADRPACAKLAALLPDRLGDLAAVEFTPKDAEGGAWGDPPLTLTCGVGVPEGFGPAANCDVVNGVDWFVPDRERNDTDSDATLTSVSLTPRVAVHVPATYRGGALEAALVDLAGPLRSALTVGTRCQ